MERSSKRIKMEVIKPIETIYVGKPNVVVMDKDKDDLEVNRCVGCGVELGDCNPRQYCNKTYCSKMLDD
jgi:hypothetical protein